MNPSSESPDKSGNPARPGRREALRRIAIAMAAGAAGIAFGGCVKNPLAPQPSGSYSSYGGTYSNYGGYSSYGGSYSSYSGGYSSYSSYSKYSSYSSYSSYNVYSRYASYSNYSNYYGNYYVASW
jgi:hypothetical protein